MQLKKRNKAQIDVWKMWREKCEGNSLRAKNKAEPKFLTSTIKQSSIPPHCGAHLAAHTHSTAVAALYKGTIEGAPSV